MSSDQPRAPQHDIDAAGDVDTVQAVSIGGGHVRNVVGKVTNVYRDPVALSVAVLALDFERIEGLRVLDASRYGLHGWLVGSFAACGSTGGFAPKLAITPALAMRHPSLLYLSWRMVL